MYQKGPTLALPGQQALEVTASLRGRPKGSYKKKVEKAKATKGGCTMPNRGDLWSQGIKISVDGENKCLPDAFWRLADHLRPGLKLKLMELSHPH